MSTPRHYFSNGLGTVEYLPDAYAHLRWSDQALSSPEWRALYVHVRNLLVRKALPGLLVDHRRAAAAPTTADQHWLLSQWLPDLVAHTPVARYAALPAADPACRLHTEAVVLDLRRYLTVALFDEPGPALSWLAA